MSHNKDIETYHKITNLPYSVCRKTLKENRWDLTRALFPNYAKALDALCEVFKPTIKLLENFADALSIVIKTVAECADEILNINDDTQ